MSIKHTMRTMLSVVLIMTVCCLPVISTISAQEGPTLKTDRQVYSPQDEIIVEYSGLPGNQKDWITIINASWPDTTFGPWWSYTLGKRSGTMTFRASDPGKYEVRLYYDHPAGGKTVHARVAFTVVKGAPGAISSKPRNPAPVEPSRPAEPSRVETPGVLAGGEPPLTQQMTDQLSDFFDWLFEIRLTSQQRQMIQNSLVASWKKKDRDEIDGALQVLATAHNLDRLSQPARNQTREKLRPEFLTLLGKQDDATSQMLIKAYEVAHHSQPTARTEIPSNPVPAPRVTPSPQTRPRPSARTSIPSQPNAKSQASEEDSPATSLAKQVLAGGKDSRDALKSALLTAGFAVRETDGRLMQAVKPGQGAVFTYMDIEAMAKMSENNTTVPLTDLATLLSRAVPKLAPAQAADFILQGVRAQTRSKFPAMRFWAEFIVALGRHSAEPYDLLAQAEPSKIGLGCVQSTLILKEVARDLRLLAANLKGKLPSAEFRRETLPRDEFFLQRPSPGYAMDQPGRAVFLPAVMRLNGPLVKASAIAWPPAPCTWDDDTVAPTGDEVALGLGFGFGKLMDYLEDNTDMWSSVSKLGSILGVANVLLAYIKLVFIFSALDVKIEMDGTGPLERTKNRKAGKRRQLTARVQLKGSPEMLNCLRQVINMIGLDFDLPADGPLEDAGVEWVMVEGGKSVATGSDYSITEPIVEFENSGLSFQDAGAGSGNISNFTRTRTDGQGRARIGVLGAAQKRVFPEDAFPFKKKFSVRVNIQVEPPNIRGTLSDGLGIVAGGPAGLLTLPAEMLLKSHWASSPTFTFSVTDWTESFKFDNLAFQVAYHSNNETLNWSEKMYGVICGDPKTEPWTIAADWEITMPRNPPMKQSPKFQTPGYMAGSAEELHAKQEFRKMAFGTAMQPGTPGTVLKVFSYDPGPPVRIILWVYAPNGTPREQTLSVPAEAFNCKE